MTAGAPTVNVGDIIAGRYRVQGWIGQGHMAVVYHAVHEGTGKPCALKLVHAHLVSRPDIVELFLKEARVGGRIGPSPYIVDVFDAAVDEPRRVPYLAMELLHGEALDHYLNTRGPMPVELVKVLVQQLGEALDQAHAAGVVHRDLKPANLFLTHSRKGEPVLKVVDFGIAKVLEMEAQRTATQIGSPAYAAPEQLGQALRRLAAKNGITIAGSVSGASDVWAMGLITYELLTGLVAGQFWGPFDSLGDLVTRVVLEDPIPATERAADRAHLLPMGFDAWISRCLAKDSTHRWSTASEAASALIRLLDGDGDVGRTIRLPSEQLAGMGEPPSGRSPGSIPPDTSAAGTKAKMPAPRSGGVAFLFVVVAVIAVLGAAAFAFLPRKGNLRIEIASDGGAPVDQVEIFVDGRKVCDATPCVARDLAEGTRTIKVIAPGGRTGAVQESVARGEERLVTVSLSPAAAPLQPAPVPEPPIEPPSQAATSVEAAPTSAPAAALTSAPAPASTSAPAPPLELSARATAPTSKSTSPALPGTTRRPAAPAASASSEPDPSAQNATLNINSIPVSKVILDGRPLGNTPKVNMSVPAGTHSITFVHQDFGKKTISVTLRPREVKTAATRFP